MTRSVFTRHTTISVGLLVASVLTVSACSNGSEVSPDSSTASAYLEALDSMMSSAQSGGADSTQIRILEESRVYGDMPYALALEAAENYISCLNDNGISATLFGGSGTSDYPRIDYVVGEDNAIADGCYQRTYFFVDVLYQMQPAAEVSVEQSMLAHQEEIIQCVTENGAVLDPDPPLDELRDAVFFVFFGFNREDPDGMPLPDHVPVDCLTVAGLSISDL